jgi:putative methanogenesis marker protein 8
MSRHVTEALGKARVVIVDGKVTEVGEPLVRYCPLFKKHRGIEEFNEVSIRENMEFRIGRFGMCTESRETRMKDFLSFGISEILSLAISKKALDAAVIAADGCGTCVLDDPEIIQGMGGRISGICETSPIKKVIGDIGHERVLDPDTAEIDQFAGVAKAFAMRYSRVGVTVASADEAAAIRDAFGSGAVIFAVHTTGVSDKDAETMFRVCDVITACASAPLRRLAATRALVKAGTKVPVYGATEAGKEMIMMKLSDLGKEPSGEDDDAPFPLI